jgi:hypothetical protein
VALLTLYNIGWQGGNPSKIVALVPGGTGTTQTVATAPSYYYPYVGIPTAEGIQREFLDVGIPGVSTPPATQGQTLFLQSVANNQGAGNFAISQLYAQAGQSTGFGVVNKISGINSADIDEPGGEGTIFTIGPCNALCTTGANAITYGTLLCSDGAGNLTSFNNPSLGATPTITPEGTSGATTYSYGLVPVSVNGTYGTITTATTAGGNATLSVSNYNQISWTPVADAVGYIVVRTSSAGTPTALGVIGYVASPNSTFNDTGLPIAPNTSATQFFQRLAAPGAPTATTAGTAGSTTYGYKISAIAPNGVWSVESTSGSTSTGNATLSAVNSIKVTWTNVTGAVLYAVDRSSSAGTPSATGLIGFATSGTLGLVDTGLTATTLTAVVTPAPTPQPGVCLAIALGTLNASTTTPTNVPVFVGGF